MYTKSYLTYTIYALFTILLASSCKKDESTVSPKDNHVSIDSLGDVEELVLYYTFDATFNNAVDELQHTATPYEYVSENSQNSVTNTSGMFTADRAGKSGMALNLDGDHFLSIADGFPTLEGSFSIHFWMKIDYTSLSNNDYYPIICKNKDCDFRLKDRLDMELYKVPPVYADEFSGLPPGTEIVPAWVRLSTDIKAKTSGSSQGVNHNFEDQVADGTWTNVVLVVDNEEKATKLYFDGKQVANDSWSFGGKMELSAVVGEVFYIGRSVCSKSSTRYKRFKGLLDDLAIIGRALTKREVEDLAAL